MSQIMFWASGFSVAACSCEVAEELFTVTSVVKVELFPLLLLYSSIKILKIACRSVCSCRQASQL